MDTRIVLPDKASLTHVSKTQGKFIIDREGRLSLSMDLEDSKNRYSAVIELGSPWRSAWFDSFGGGQSSNVIDLEIDDLKVSCSSSQRGSFREAPVGTLAVSEIGVVLVSQPYSGDEKDDLVISCLTSRGRGNNAGDIVHILSGWVIRGYRGRDLAFEVHQPTA